MLVKTYISVVNNINTGFVDEVFVALVVNVCKGNCETISFCELPCNSLEIFEETNKILRSFTVFTLWGFTFFIK